MTDTPQERDGDAALDPPRPESPDPVGDASPPELSTGTIGARSLDRLPELSRAGLWSIAGASALGAGLSSASAVGVGAADILWSAALGIVVVLAASRARRWALVWIGGISAVVGISGDPAGVISAIVVLLLAAFVAFSSTRRDRWIAALIGAFAVQALLRGPSYGPTWLPTLVGLIAVGPVLWSGYRMANRRERTLSRRVAVVIVASLGILATLATVGVALSRNDLRAAERGATTGLDLVREGETEAAATRFAAATSAFEDAAGSLNGPMTWGGTYLPVIGQHLEALRLVADAGTQLTQTAEDIAATADYRSLTAEGGVVDVERLASLRQPVAEASATINDAVALTAGIDSPWLLPIFVSDLERFRSQLDDIDEQTQLASEGLGVAPAMLGADGPKRYLIAFSTPAESRNGGGFIGAYGIIQADNGRLELLESGKMRDLNPTGGLRNAYDFVPPTDWQERYGTYFVQLFLGNLGASPDWPTDTGVAGQLLPQTPSGITIDGAIYADPAALATLLSLTGPIEVPGIELALDANNAERYLLVDQYVDFEGDNDERQERLGDVADATFDALTSRPLPGISRLSELLGPLVADGHLRVSSFDPAAETFLDRIGLSGRWQVTPGSDFLSVRSANLLPNKIDAFLHRDIDVVTVVEPETGALTTEMTVELRNDAPAEGLPSYIIGNTGTQPPGTNSHLLTVHTPHALESATIDGVPVGFQAQREFDAPTYSIVANIPPTSTRTLRLVFRGTVPSWPYTLEVLPQATANPDRMSISIEGVPGLGPTPQFAGELGPRFRIPTAPASSSR